MPSTSSTLPGAARTLARCHVGWRREVAFESALVLLGLVLRRPPYPCPTRERQLRLFRRAKSPEACPIGQTGDLGFRKQQVLGSNPSVGSTPYFVLTNSSY